MKCKSCGHPINDYSNVAYCPVCRVKRMMKTMEIDHETGLWEGQEV